jgi:SET domain-containing protein
MAEREGEPAAMYEIRKTEGKGCGLFAARDIERGEHILRIDMRPLKKYAVQELAEHEELDGDHADYVGHGKYVIDHSPGSYMNHSCDPTCYYKMRSIAVKDVYAARDIREGEELTHDYTATSVDQFAGHGFWVLECKCGSITCRGKVTGDFFELPIDLQRQYYPNLVPSIRRKHRDRFKQLACYGASAGQ